MKRNPAPSPEAAAIIKEFEGCHKRLPDGTFAAYPDPGSGGDPWTIGWGSTGPDIKRGTIWTQAQCDARFAEHLAEFGAKVAELLRGAPTTQAQFDAMTSLAYNIGTGNFGSSTLLRKHRAGDYAAAADQFAVWNRASGRVMAGLTRRRAAEAAMYRGHSA
ncbi:MAG: lysozyme [Alphaproteobacteria bacterium]|nr:MAG: lysozyme [Alphaproteobacteria bacterium]